LKEVSSVPSVLDTGDDGEGERKPEEGRHDPEGWVGQDREEELFLTEGLEEEPDQGGDAEADLKSGFPFSAPICGDDPSFLDRDLAQTGDEKFAGKDDDDDPGRTESLILRAEKYEGRGGEDLVGDGVEQFSEGGDEVELAGEVAIEEICDSGQNEGDQGDSVADRARNGEPDHEDGGEDQSRDGERIGEVQHAQSARWLDKGQ